MSAVPAVISGVAYPPFPNVEDKVQNIQNMITRSDDVYILAYPKSGSHWVMEVVLMLLRRVAKHGDYDLLDMLIEFQEQTIIEQARSPRVMHSHVLFDKLPADMFRKCKVISITRDPRDAIVSFYEFHKSNGYSRGSWSEYFTDYMAGKVFYGTWFRYIRSWENALASNPDISILKLRFEDMKTHLESAVQRISEFLGLDHSAEFCAEVAESCQFRNSKKQKESILLETSQVAKRNLYRKGIVGDWKNRFTVAEAELFEKIYQQEMSGSKLKSVYEYNKPQ